MSQQSLAAMVEQLDKQIEEARSLSPGDRELLEDLRRDIQNLLDRSEPGTRDALVERLRNETERFEASHPNLTSALAQMLDTLTKLGI